MNACGRTQDDMNFSSQTVGDYWQTQSLSHLPTKQHKLRILRDGTVIVFKYNERIVCESTDSYLWGDPQKVCKFVINIEVVKFFLIK